MNGSLAAQDCLPPDDYACCYESYDRGEALRMASDEETDEEYEYVDNGFRSSPLRFWFGEVEAQKYSGEDSSTTKKSKSTKKAKSTKRSATATVAAACLDDIACPRCGIHGTDSDGRQHIKKNGYDKYGKQLLFCNRCRRGFSTNNYSEMPPSKTESVKKVSLKTNSVKNIRVNDACVGSWKLSGGFRLPNKIAQFLNDHQKVSVKCIFCNEVLF